MDTIKLIEAKLKLLYPQVSCPLVHNSAWELLVATILSSQSTDVRVNQITPTLFRCYPDINAFAVAKASELLEIIKPVGLGNIKSKNIIASAQHLLKYHDGKVPNDLDGLLALPGVGKKIATVVLGNWFKINVGFTVDTHVKRVARRLGLTNHSDPVNIEKDLMQKFARDEWSDMSLRLIFYGREYCKARGPECELCLIVKNQNVSTRN